MIYTMNQENPKDRLSIFDNFQVDMNLPKFKKERDEKADDQKISNIIRENGIGSSNGLSGAINGSSVAFYSTASTASTFMVSQGGWQISNPMADSVVGGLEQQYTKRGIFASLVRWLSNKKENIVKKCETKRVQYVFDLVLNQPEKLTKFEEKNSAYAKLIENAKSLGQTALVEQLESELEVRKFENACLANDITMALTEKQLLTFADKCEKGLKLDWIKNFTRVIPQMAIEKKQKADENFLFDNYVILYFDPENKATKMTKKDIEKAKDPILFGVMHGNRRLYFIHDWKDELCDLTMKEVADKLGTKENLSLELPT